MPAYAASVLADGALQGVSKRVGEEDDLPKFPKVTNGYCFPPGMVLPMSSQAGSWSAPQTPRHSAVTFPSSIAAAPPTQPYSHPQVPDVLRPHASPSSRGQLGPLPSPSPALLPLGVPRPRVSIYMTYFPYVLTILSDASRQASWEQSSGAGICRTCEAAGFLLLIPSFGRWL